MAQSGCQMPAHPCPQGAKGSEGSSTQEGTCTSSQSHDSPDLLGPAEWETWNSRQGCKPRFPVPSLSVACRLNTQCPVTVPSGRGYLFQLSPSFQMLGHRASGVSNRLLPQGGPLSPGQPPPDSAQVSPLPRLRR